MFQKIIITILLLASSLFAGKYPVNSIEYGVSLKTEKFKNGISDVEAFQKSLFDNISIARLKDDSLKLDASERVSYWDTKDNLFRKQKLIIRHRGEDKKFEITIKYRGSKQENAENFDLLINGKAKTKTEIDRYINKDAFSRSITLKTKENTLTSKILLELFPGLRNYGFTQDMQIEKVNDFAVNSISYELGEYRFGPKKAKKKTTTSNFDLTLWQCDNGKIVAAEVSWKIRNEGVKMKSATKQARKTLELLTKNLEWADMNPKTKTSIAYEANGICK